MVFGSPHAVVARLNIEGLHRGAVAAAKALEHAHDEVRAGVCDLG